MGKKKTIQGEGGNVSLAEENMSLKRKIGGLTASNENYRKQVESLKSDVNRYKALSEEGDLMYEAKISECDSLLKQLDTLEKTNAQLRGQIESYKDQVLVLNDRIGELNREADRLAAELSKPATPWWKRIF